MKKISKVLLLLMVLMAFVAVPALAESGYIFTYDNVLQATYDKETVTDPETGDELTITGFVSTVYGQLLEAEGVLSYGVQIKYYGDSVWGKVERMATKSHTVGRNDNGDFGIKFIDLREGYYSARAYALYTNNWDEAVYGGEVYFTVGETYKADYALKYCFADASGKYVEDEDLGSVRRGSIGATVYIPQMGEFDGYVLNESASKASGEVTEDGSLVLSLNYDVADTHVYYDFNGGENANGDTYALLEKNADQSFASLALTRPGYAFAGWATDAEGENVVADTTGVTGLFAVWQHVNPIAVYDMAYNISECVDDNGELLFASHGPGRSTQTFYASVLNEYAVGVVGTAWTHDGHYMTFPVWQNPTHTTQYVGSIIKTPSVALENLESITIRYLNLNAGGALQSGAVYLSANAAKTTNDTTSGVTMANGASASYQNANEITISKAQLLATMPEDDNTALHSLYLDGEGYLDTLVAIDSIRFNTTDATIEGYYASDYTSFEVNHYTQKADDTYDVDSKTYTVLKGLGYELEIFPRSYDALDYDANHDGTCSVATIADDGSTVFNLYYDYFTSEVNYHLNDGTDAIITRTQKSVEPLLDKSEGVFWEGHTFMGWSTTAQSETLNVDAGSVVGRNTDVYAVWYDLDWLNFNTSATVYNTLTAGSLGYSESGIESKKQITFEDEASEDGAGYSVITRQNPTAGSAYIYGVIRLPHIDLSKLFNIKITYKVYQEKGTNSFIFSFNENMTKTGTENNLTLPRTNTLTTLTFTKDQIMAYTGNATHLDCMYIGAVAWNAQSVIIDKIEVTTNDADYPEPLFDITYDYNGGTDGTNSKITLNDVAAGASHIDGTTLTKTGYTFYGWAKGKVPTTFDEMVASYNEADNGYIVEDATYYAVWYGDDWLEFNGGSAVNNLIVKGSYSQDYNSCTDIDVDGDGTADGVAGGRLNTAAGVSGYDHIKILTPRVDFADIVNIQFKAKSYYFSWQTPYYGNVLGSGKWFNFGLNGVQTSYTGDGVSNGMGFSTGASGIVSNTWNSATIMGKLDSPAITDGTTTLKYFSIVSTQTSESRALFMDYIRLTIGASYTTEYYFQNEAGEYEIDDSMTSLYAGNIGATVNATRTAVDGFAVDTSKGVLSGTVAEDDSLTLKVYYNKVSAYAIEHYFEVDGEYVKDEELSSSTTGTALSVVTPTPLDVDGYYFDADHDGAYVSGAIAYDGSTVFKLYYTLIRHEVTYNYNGGEYEGAGSKKINVFPGTAIDETIVPTKLSGVFQGWTATKDGTDYVTDPINADIELFASWYDLTALEMSHFTYKGEDKFVSHHGTGTAYLPSVQVNYASSKFDVNWADDGKYINVNMWSNPASANQYVGTKILLPDLDMSKLESITIRYSAVTSSDNPEPVGRTVYVRGNATVTTNVTTNAVAMRTDIYGGPTSLTITKDQLLATMPEGDNATLHTLFFDGYNYEAAVFLIDSIRINSTQDEIVAHNARYVSMDTQVYTPNGDGYDMQTLRTNTVLSGTTITIDVPEIAGYDYDEDNANNANGIVADGTNALKFYYNLPYGEVTYDFNGGVNSEGESSAVVTQYGTDSFASFDITNGDKILLGWSTTQQSNTVTVDKDGKVGTDTTFYAVWYDPAWLTFDGLETATFNSLTEGSVSKSNTGSSVKITAKQWPVVTDGTYVYGAIRMPNIVIDDTYAIKITYKNTAADTFYMDVNGRILFANSNEANSSKSKLYALPQATDFTTVTISQDQLRSLADGASVIETLNFCVMSWSSRTIEINNIDIVSLDDALSFTTEYWLEKPAGGYELDSTQTTTRYGFAGDEVVAEKITIDGYYFLEGYELNVETAVLADGTTTVLRLYYNSSATARNYYYNDGTQNATVIKQWSDEALIPAVSKDGAFFMGWSTVESPALNNVYTEATVGENVNFYAVWYELSWLNFATADGTSQIVKGGGPRGSVTSNYYAFDSGTGSDDGYGVQVKIQNCPGHSTEGYATIMLPHVEISKLTALKIHYMTTGGNNGGTVEFTVAFNTKPTKNNASGTADATQIAMAHSKTAMSVLTITPEMLATSNPSDTHLDTLYLNGANWQDRRIMVDRIDIVTSDSEYVVPITYDFNGGKDASGNTTFTTTSQVGDPVMDGVNLVREGYTFFGWAKVANVTTYDKMALASDLVDSGVVTHPAKYYAVWYADEWLQFNNPTINAMLISTGGTIHNGTMDHDGSTDTADIGVLGGGWTKGIVAGNSTTYYRLLLPRIPLADIASITYSAYARSGDNTTACSDTTWFVIALNAPFSANLGTGQTNTFSDYNSNTTTGLMATSGRTPTQEKIQGYISGGLMTESNTYLKSFYVGSSQNKARSLVFDYITITKNA